MDLSDDWVAVPADDDTRRTFADDDLDTTGWEPIEVPGHWRSHPAFSDVDDPVLYRTEFDLVDPEPGRRWWLTFEGLFYQGDIWLDGTYLGDTEGYFHPHTFEITEQVAARSSHVLGVDLACGAERDPSAKTNITGVFQHGEYIDSTWNPGGIWRPVRISDTGPVRITDLTTRCVSADDARAVIAFTAELNSLDALDVVLHTTVGLIDHDHPITVAAGANSVEWTVTVDRPRLWWPHRLGDPHTETVTVEVSLGDEGDAVSDSRSLRTGLRTVSMRNWIMSVNGERMFLQGATQGPTRMALAEATDADCSDDVASAVDIGLDLLRVHGHVALPATYAAADAAGLLLWQDFPLQGRYNRHIRKQAVRQARRMARLLAHHPSIAMWCAHDEPYDSDASGAALVLRQQLPSWNRTVLDRAVRSAIRSVDDTRPVVAHSGVPPHLPRLSGTDSHIAFGWTSGEEREFAGFTRAMPSRVRFPSRFGAQAVPASDDFVGRGDWPALDWERLEARHGLDREALERHVPSDGLDYESWRAATQEHQSEVLRRHIETLRRIKYRPTGGFAAYAFADSHPAISHAVLDHERRPKPAFEALAAACAPVIVVADRLQESLCPGDAVALDIHVVSDVRVPLSGEVTARLRWIEADGSDGVHEWRFGGDVDADACARVGTIQFEVPHTASELVLELSGQIGDHVVANRYRAGVHHH